MTSPYPSFETPATPPGGSYFPSFGEMGTQVPPSAEGAHNPYMVDDSAQDPNFIMLGMLGLDENDPRRDPNYPDSLDDEGKKAFFDRFSWQKKLHYWANNLEEDAEPTTAQSSDAISNNGLARETSAPRVWELSVRVTAPFDSKLDDEQVLKLVTGVHARDTIHSRPHPEQPSPMYRQVEPVRKALVAPLPPPSNATRRPVAQPETRHVPANVSTVLPPASPEDSTQDTAPQPAKRRRISLKRVGILALVCVSGVGLNNFINDAANGPKGYSSVIETDQPKTDMLNDIKRLASAAPIIGLVL